MDDHFSLFATVKYAKLSTSPKKPRVSERAQRNGRGGRGRGRGGRVPPSSVPPAYFFQPDMPFVSNKFGFVCFETVEDSEKVLKMQTKFKVSRINVN